MSIDGAEQVTRRCSKVADLAILQGEVEALRMKRLALFLDGTTDTEAATRTFGA